MGTGPVTTNWTTMASGYKVPFDAWQSIERMDLHRYLTEWVGKLQCQSAPFTPEEQMEIISLLAKCPLTSVTFYLDQLHQPTCYGPARELIVDTLSLVCYDQCRRHDVLLYGSIINPDRQPDPLAVTRAFKHDRNQFNAKALQAERRSFMARWLATPGGFNDMLYLLYVIVNGPIPPGQPGFFLNTQS